MKISSRLARKTKPKQSLALSLAAVYPDKGNFSLSLSLSSTKIALLHFLSPCRSTDDDDTTTRITFSDKKLAVRACVRHSQSSPRNPLSLSHISRRRALLQSKVVPPHDYDDGGGCGDKGRPSSRYIRRLPWLCIDAPAIISRVREGVAAAVRVD